VKTMKLRSCLTFSLVLVLAALTALAPVHGSGRPGTAVAAAPPLPLALVVDQLIQKNAERALALEQFRGRRLYTIDYTGFPKMHAEMVVDLLYTAPGTKDFTIVSESGSGLLLSHVLKRLLATEKESLEEKNRSHVELNKNNYDFAMAGYLPSPEGCSYVLMATPRAPNKFQFRGRIWVDENDFAVCKIEAEPALNPSFWIKKTDVHHQYEKVGDFWFPKENRSVSDIRFDGTAILTIKYLNYEILAVRGHAPKSGFVTGAK
jgi:hypothetical protein